LFFVSDPEAHFVKVFYMTKKWITFPAYAFFATTELDNLGTRPFLRWDC